MVDRVTQIQDAINQQAENFCNGIGVLQQSSTSSEIAGLSRPSSQTPQQQEDYAQVFASNIARCAKEIDSLIGSLPSDEYFANLHPACFQKLETENQDAAKKLEEMVSHGEHLLEQVQGVLAYIAQNELELLKPLDEE